MTAAYRVAALQAAYFTAVAVTAFIPLWFADRGLTAAQIGQILGAASLLRVVAGPQWGTVADAIGRRPVLLLTGLVATGLALLYPAMSGFLPLLVVAVGQGVAASALNPLIDSLALALAREGRLEYGPVRAAGTAACMIATAFIGWLLTRSGTWLVPWLLAFGYAAVTLLTPGVPDAAGPVRRGGLSLGLGLFRNRAFRLTVGCTALIQASHAAYYGFGALFFRSLGYSDTVIGLLVAEGMVAEIALFLWGRRCVERLGSPGLTACAAGAALLRWGITACAPPLALLAMVQVLHAATFGMQHLSAMRMLTACVPPERAATAQALHSALGYGAPTGLMMILAGWLYARSSGTAFLAMAICGGLGLLLAPRLARVQADRTDLA